MLMPKVGRGCTYKDAETLATYAKRADLSQAESLLPATSHRRSSRLLQAEAERSRQRELSQTGVG
jgi:hypothetical protein